MYSVIFDMDGTLLDTQRIYIPAWDYAGENQGFKKCGDHIKNVLGTNEEAWTQYLVDNFKGVDVARFKADATDYIKKNIVIRFKEGAEELIAYLRKNGIKYAIGSGAATELIRTYLQVLGASDLFDTVAGGEEIKNSKPAPDTFLLAAEKMGVDPKECFVFEDSDNGALAAYNAGMRCIGIPDVVPFSRETKSHLFAELGNLAEAIEVFEALKH